MKHIIIVTISAFIPATLFSVVFPTARGDDNPYAAMEGPTRTAISVTPKVKPPSTALTFAVNVGGKIKSYSDNQTEDVSVLLPMNSPWRCVRRRVMAPTATGMSMGSFVCADDHEERSEVIVSTSCGIPGENHNSATLIYAGTSSPTVITLKVDCVSAPEPSGF